MSDSAAHEASPPLNPFNQWMNQGAQSAERSQWAQAVQCFCAAIEIKPDSSMAFHQLGLSMCQLGQFQAGVECFDSAIRWDPCNPLPVMDRGNAFKELGHAQLAMNDYLQALQLKPDYAIAHFNLASLYRQQMQLQKAADCYRAVLELEPQRPDVWSNLGVTLKELGEFDRALTCFDQALAIDPGFADASWNKATTLLMRGNYKSGWPLFESRWQLDAAGLAKQSQLTSTLWLGEASLRHRTILICTEQGLGDTIQCLRYLRLLVDMGAQVLVEVQASLVRLVSQIDGLAGVMVYGEPRPATDFHCPFMSLPLAFKTDLSTIPFAAGYLQADKLLSAEWANKLAQDRRPKVGLVWSGGDLFAANARRNIPLSTFEVLGTLPLSFHSLQVGASARQALNDLKAAEWQGPNITDQTDLLTDFADTAALVDNLDLVIAVDTSVAHLAGAMGKPTWLLNRFDGCWRWLKHRTDSPWYQSMRVFNQSNPTEWLPVLETVQHELQQLSRN